jgi:hypothetical protein
MNIFISIKLTQRLGFWVEVHPLEWRRGMDNYHTLNGEQSVFLSLGPLSLGGSWPTNEATAERIQADWERCRDKL